MSSSLSLNDICIAAAKKVGVGYDPNAWKTFHNVRPDKVKQLYDALMEAGAFPPPLPPILDRPPPLPSPTELMSKRLGPTFEELNPNAGDFRPTLYQPPTIETDPNKFGDRVNPWEVGAPSGPRPETDYWSTVGQIAYIPNDKIIGDAGLDRIQTFAYYSHVYAISPRFEGPKARMGREHFTDCADVPGHNTMVRPACCVRNYGMLSNEAIVVYENGYIMPAGTQTSRGGDIPFDWPLPGLQLPPEKKPLCIALSTSNEFAFIGIQDTKTGKGQIAIVACEGHCLPFHTFKYLAMPNQGSWSAFRLMGYVNLPFTDPDSISAATNGLWMGPSATAGKTLGQIDITESGTRWGLRQGELGWSGIVAINGYIIVSSKTAGKVAVLDLTPLMTWVRQCYLDDDKQAATLAGHLAGTWPGQLTPENTPKVVWEFLTPRPTCVLAGCVIDRWSTDCHKAYIAREDGLIQILDTSTLVNRWSWESLNPLTIIGEIKVGANPISMCFARFNPGNLPLIPAKQNPDCLNNVVHVCCRGARRIDSIVSMYGRAQIYQTLVDTRLNDPCHISVTDRGNIVTICNFIGQKVVSYRLGPLFDRVDTWGQVGARWEPGSPLTPEIERFECAGELSVTGSPFWSGSSNLN